MAWSSLGTLTPSFNWQSFEVPVTGDIALRVTQEYQTSELTFINRLYLSEQFATGERRFLFSLYPTKEVRIYSLQLPSSFVTAGLTVRHLSLKHNRYGVVAEANWSVTLETWMPVEG